MDIIEQIESAISKAGDNSELSSELSGIKSSAEAIIGKKSELETKFSGLQTEIKGLGVEFGSEKEASKDIFSDIRKFKSDSTTRIDALSTDKDGYASKYADLEIKMNEKMNAMDSLISENTNEKNKNALLGVQDKIKEHLSLVNIKDLNSQKLALAGLKDSHGDLLSIEDIEGVVNKFAENNPRMVDSSLKSGNGGKIDVSAIANKEIKYGMPPEEEAAILKARRESKGV